MVNGLSLLRRFKRPAICVQGRWGLYMGPEASRGRLLGVAAAVRPKGSSRPPALSTHALSQKPTHTQPPSLSS